ALARERGTKPKEQWYLLQRVAYWEKEDYRKVRSILEILVTNWPKKEYWSQLSGIYYELKDESRQLAAYEAAYDQGLLETSSELTQMAQLFMQSEVPFKGAQVLEEGLASGKIEKNERNLRLLSQAWQMAQEDRKAIEPLQQAAKLSNDGDLYARLATSYLNLDQYKNCISASRNAINKGGLKYPGDTWLVLGMCQFENKQLSAAKTSFQNAAKYDKSAKNARSWITYTENEQARLQQLQESLNQLNEARQRAAERADS
ncbi:MAG: tetratricopeptide repeat protein, partial [Gammaproteobacteria bacterium]|nr:tetratricopeptide repeat protein [Gammaproteobacteria bacterium]